MQTRTLVTTMGILLLVAGCATRQPAEPPRVPAVTPWWQSVTTPGAVEKPSAIMVNATRPSALPPPDIANLRLLKAHTYDDLETGTWVSIFGEVEGLSQAWEAQRPVIEISLLDDAGQTLTTIEALVFRSTADEREETFTQGSFKAGTAWHTRLASLALRGVCAAVPVTRRSVRTPIRHPSR